ncbi:MAG TPA: M20/M25/M40 family metallo-hydrolase [Vicinamibacterales bacterium]|nr:M20/M25/M40 family metallo-hydrolase [Vicinamibacterales bacterium]
MRRSLSAVFLLTITVSLGAQTQNPLDTATINKIRGEAVANSQAMETHWWLSEAFGPRATGTPGYQKAADWAMGKFKEWGLQNIHIERFPFGQGWTIERFSVHMTTPTPAPLIGMPRWYSPSTSGPVTSDVVHVRATSEAELEKYKGQLRGKIVVLQAPRAVRMLDGRIILRMNDEDWKEAMTLPEPPAPGAKPAQAGPGAAQQFAQAVQRFLVAEGAAVVLDRGSDSDLSAGGSDLSWQTQRVDGGTIFPGNGGSRDPKVPQQVPSATLAVEHYNRIVRLLERGQPVQMEVNIQTTFHAETDSAGNAFNIIAEIPGSDLAKEVVIMGAHFDTYPYATGATDNTTGVTAMMEAVRVIQALGLKPRRTIRIALWAAEEQGLLGSREYVARHYFDAKTGTPKADHANVQAYFNLDNGTGRIRGIWGQGNTGAMKLFDQWGRTVKDLGWANVSPRSVSQTDHGSFENAGLPGFQFIQERLEYNSRTHHSNMDTFDHVQKDDVIQQGAIAAVFAWHAANVPEQLPRKPLPAGSK